MSTDFYIDEKWLAAYFEKDWFDQVIQSPAHPSVQLEYPSFDLQDLYSDYHEKMVLVLKQELGKISAEPKSMLEVGSALGRTYYEVCKRIDSLQVATLVEPSKNLLSLFHKIFRDGGEQSFPVQKGNNGLSSLQMNTDPIKQACAKVDVSTYNEPFTNLPKDLKPSDLVICSNVIDQCHNPRDLVQFIQDQTAPAGVLVLSCTYQWNPKYENATTSEIKNINDLFGKGWTYLNETNLSFKVRRSERFWMQFLSQVSIFQKDP